jgi:hypothetical protein
MKLNRHAEGDPGKLLFRHNSGKAPATSSVLQPLLVGRLFRPLQVMQRGRHRHMRCTHDCAYSHNMHAVSHHADAKYLHIAEPNERSVRTLKARTLLGCSRNAVSKSAILPMQTPRNLTQSRPQQGVCASHVSVADELSCHAQQFP